MKLTLLLVISWAVYVSIRFLFIFPWTPEMLVITDRLEPCDLIVFLAGEYYERIDYAFELAEQGYSQKIFAASITYEEALDAKKFVESRNINSMLLVTSFYHSLRAAWVFRRIMPNIKIVSAPVGPAC